MSVELSESALSQFCGTESYYRHWTGALVYTDGVHYLVEHGAAWLVDAIASYQPDKKLSRNGLQDFQLWTLTVTDSAAVLTCKADSGRPDVIRQEIEYTDFPLATMRLYVEAGEVGGKAVRVLLLPNEH